PGMESSVQLMALDRAGIAVRTRSDYVTIENNVIYSRGGAGVTLKGLKCGVIRNNVVLDNRQKGIEIREGHQMLIANNLVIGNRSPGVYLADQAPGETTLIRDNLFIGNGAGLGGASGQNFALVSNNFVKQFPRFVQGDLANQTDIIVQDLRGESPLVLSAGGPLNVPVPDVACNE
ncbi:MAG: right-handed parallel beta-helix repeat-containing protein, partial [Paracoccaceae bacterium]